MELRFRAAPYRIAGRDKQGTEDEISGATTGWLRLGHRWLSAIAPKLTTSARFSVPSERLRMRRCPDESGVLLRSVRQHVPQQQANELRDGALFAVGAKCQRAAFV